MNAFRKRRWLGFAMAAVMPLGCTKDEPSSGKSNNVASQPSAAPTPANASLPSSPAPVADVIPRDSLKWTKTEAIAKLTDEKLRVAAAVRLARLAKYKSEMLPDPLTKEQAAQLAVVRVSDDLFALGRPDAKTPRTLRNAVFFNKSGNLVRPGDHAPQAQQDATVPPPKALAHEAGADDTEELPTARSAAREQEKPKEVERSPFEQKNANSGKPVKKDAKSELSPVDAAPPAEYGDWLLYDAEDPEVFPRLIVGRARVFDVKQIDEPLLALKTPEKVHFDMRVDDGFPFIPLVTEGKNGVEAARYTWDPYELLFTGPARDKLPAGADGVFELDVDASHALQPVGGLIPEKKFENKRPDAPKEDEAPPM